MRPIRLLVAWWALLAVVLAAQEPTDEEKRAEAHRTIMRRLSVTEEAKTVTLGLSKDATAFVDLYLDMHRNKDDVRRGRAPRSRMFMGVVHPVMRIVEGRLAFAVSFVQFTIDQVRVPVAELPSILNAALGAKFDDAVRVASDSKRHLPGFTMQLVAEMASVGDAHLDDAARERSGWTELKARAARHIIQALDELGPREMYPVLNCLKRFGDDTTAQALIDKLAAIPERTASLPKRRIYVGAIVGMRGNKARDFFKKIMAGDDTSLKAAALGGLGRAPDEEVYGILEGILAPDTEAGPPLKMAAISALGRFKDPRAVGILEKAFEQATDDMEKYSVACQLTRMNSPAAIPYLEAKAKELEADKDRRGMADYVKRLLEDYRQRNPSKKNGKKK